MDFPFLAVVSINIEEELMVTEGSAMSMPAPSVTQCIFTCMHIVFNIKFQIQIFRSFINYLYSQQRNYSAKRLIKNVVLVKKHQHLFHYLLI